MKKWNIWLKRLAGAIVFSAVLAAMVLRLDSALKPTQEENLCGRYYKYPKDTFDVIFLGSSFALYGIYPMELYREYGIASYNLATGNQSIEASYYLAKEAIERDHPSLIVLDCNMAWNGQETMKAEHIHYITDTMPYLSLRRIEMIRNLADPEEALEPLYFPLIAFHSRWQELTYADAVPQAKEMVYGCKITSRTTQTSPFSVPEKTEDQVPEVSLKYLQQIMELCRENGTELLLIDIPVLGKNRYLDQSGLNRRWTVIQELEKIADGNGTPFLNLFAASGSLGFDLQKETTDGEHMNRWGAARFTEYLGGYLMEHYDLPDRRGTGGAWKTIDADAEVYPVNRMRDSLREARSFREYTEVLRSDAGGDEGEAVEDALVLISLNGPVNQTIMTPERAAFLQGFGLQQDLRSMKGHSWLAVIDGGNVVYETAPGEEDAVELYEGTAGVLRYAVKSGRADETDGEILSYASITVNGLEYTNENRGLFFAVFNRKTGELLDASRIDLYSDSMRCLHDNH